MLFSIENILNPWVRYRLAWLLHVVPCLIAWWLLSVFDVSSNHLLILFVILGFASVCTKMEVYYEKWCESQVDNQEQNIK